MNGMTDFCVVVNQCVMAFKLNKKKQRTFLWAVVVGE